VVDNQWGDNVMVKLVKRTGVVTICKNKQVGVTVE